LPLDKENILKGCYGLIGLQLITTANMRSGFSGQTGCPCYLLAQKTSSSNNESNSFQEYTFPFESKIDKTKVVEKLIS